MPTIIRATIFCHDFMIKMYNKEMTIENENQVRTAVGRDRVPVLSKSYFDPVRPLTKNGPKESKSFLKKVENADDSCL